MNADQEVAKLRSLLYSHTRFLAAIPPVELDAIYARLHSCGLSGSTTSAVELETCLTDIPSKEKYIEFQKGYVTYDKQLEIVKQRFPEYSQLDPEKQAELLVLVNQQEAEKVLSEYLSNRKK